MTNKVIQVMIKKIYFKFNFIRRLIKLFKNFN